MNNGLHNHSEAEQFEAFFSSATIGIILSNRKGEIINFNPFASRQFGYSKEEVLGKSIDILIPGRFGSHHHDQRESFYRNPQARVMGAGRDLHALRKDGTEFPVEISLSAYGSGDDICVIAFIIDITIRKNNELTVIRQKQELEESSARISRMNMELEEKVEARTKMLRETLAELEHSREELSEALKKEKDLGDLKTGFVTLASHEFRTPLSTILSSAYLLEQYNPKDEDYGKREKHLQRIRSSVESLKSILEDFLSLGKLEEGSVQVRMELLPFAELKKMAEDITGEMQQVTTKNLQIVTTFKEKEPATIDVQLLRNVLVNLMSNAIKFSHDTGLVSLAIDSTPAGLTACIKDEGIGISKEDQQHLFERFFRAKNASAIQGTGLGLNIVSKYLELMNGSLQLQSELNAGTQVSIFIPRDLSLNPSI